jgi:hypothetical protein
MSIYISAVFVSAFLLCSEPAFAAIDTLTFFGWSDQHVKTNGNAEHLVPAIDGMNTMPGRDYPLESDGKVDEPAFVFGLGDITEWPTRAARDTYNNLITRRLKFPSYDVAGNHDSGGRSPSPTIHDWLVRRHRSLSYTFDVGGVHFVALYSPYDEGLNSPAQPITKGALDYLRSDLAKLAEGTPVVVGTHLCFEAITNKDELVDAFGGANVILVLGGHYHKASVNQYRGFNFVQLPSPAPGSPNEFTVFRISGDRLLAIPFDYGRKSWISDDNRVLNVKVQGPVEQGAAQPKPGKSDTFELDTYLRRNSHPLTVKLIAHEAAAVTNVPVTMGIGCGEGDYSTGSLCPVLNGKNLPAQVDVLATWPTDGSIKHALVTVVIPNIFESDTPVLEFRRARPPKPPEFDLAVLLEDWTASVQLTGEDGSLITSSIPRETITEIKNVLTGKVDSKKLCPRLAGPIYYEFELHDTPTQGTDKDPDIDVFYRLRFYSRQTAVRVAYVVENTRIPALPYPQQFTVTDRKFRKLRFLAGSTAGPKQIYSHGSVTHWYGTRYRVVGWTGSAPAEIYAKEDLAYLIYSQFFPKLDLDNRVTPIEATDALKRWAAKYDPVRFPLGKILSCDPVDRNMPGTGGRPDIGAYARWHRLALSAESPQLHGLALSADGNGLASFPIHRREVGSQNIGAPFDAGINKVVWDGLLGRRSSMTYDRQDRCPNKPDYAHTPSASFYAYLTTGDKFFEEELAFWAMYPSYVWPHTGILPGTTRAAAWQLRNVTDAAFLLPDNHNRKQYLTQYVDRNLSDMQRRLDERGHLLSGPRKCSGRKHWVCSGQTSIWQYTWLIWSLDNTARKGWPQCTQIRDDAADILLRLYEGKEEFTGPNGKTYRFEFKGAMPYSLATDLIEVEFNDKGQEKDTFLRPITNTGEMYYYTLLNISNMYYFTDKQKETAWVAELPGRLMKPEDWQLDPAVEKKGTGGLSHEYGNSECSAALARYDNLRAEKMYQFVRKTINEASRPDYQPRFRGIEYTK